MKGFRLTIIVAALVVLGVIFRVPILRAVSASYNTTVRIVDSAGNVINGTASAVTASYNETVRVVDSNGNVIDSFGGGTAVPTPAIANPLATPLPTPTAGILRYNGTAVPTVSELSGAVTTAGTNVTSVTGWPLASFAWAPPGVATAATVIANKLYLTEVQIPSTVSFRNIAIFINTADNTHNSDFGIYNSAGTLLADVGAQALAAAGVSVSDLPFVQNANCTASGAPSACCTGTGTGTCPVAPLTLTPGIYYLGVTSATSTTLKFDTQTQPGIQYFAGSNQYSDTSGGQLAASITAPTLAIANFSGGVLLH